MKLTDVAAEDHNFELSDWWNPQCGGLASVSVCEDVARSNLMFDWGITCAMVSSCRYERSKEVRLNWGERFGVGEGTYIRIPGFWVASCKRARLSAAEHT